MEIGESANWPPGGQGLHLPPTVYSRVSPGGGTPWSWASVLTRKRNQLWHALGNTPFVPGTKFKLLGQALEVLSDLASAYFSSLISCYPGPPSLCISHTDLLPGFVPCKLLWASELQGSQYWSEDKPTVLEEKNVYKRYSVGGFENTICYISRNRVH